MENAFQIQWFPNFLNRDTINQLNQKFRDTVTNFSSCSLERKILTVWIRKFDSLEKENFDSFKRNFWQFGKGKIWQFEKENFTVWIRKFDSLEKENFDSLTRKILAVWKRKILTVRKQKFWQFEKGKFWQFAKGNFDSLEKEILTVWKGKFWQFEKENFDSFRDTSNFLGDSLRTTDPNPQKKNKFMITQKSTFISNS
jgi:hypothetical protein